MGRVNYEQQKSLSVNVASLVVKVITSRPKTHAVIVSLCRSFSSLLRIVEI